jgi:hypothetical protein
VLQSIICLPQPVVVVGCHVTAVVVPVVVVILGVAGGDGCIVVVVVALALVVVVMSSSLVLLLLKIVPTIHPMSSGLQGWVSVLDGHCLYSSVSPVVCC